MNLFIFYLLAGLKIGVAYFSQTLVVFFPLSILVLLSYALLSKCCIKDSYYKSIRVLVGGYFLIILVAHIALAVYLSIVHQQAGLIVLMATIPLSLLGGVMVLFDSIVIHSVRKFLSKLVVGMVALILLLATVLCALSL